MRKHVLAGVGAIGLTIASWTTALAVAAAILNPGANRTPNGDVIVGWSPSSQNAMWYHVEQCTSSTREQCYGVRVVMSDQHYTDYSAVIDRADVIADKSGVVRIVAVDEEGHELEDEWTAIPQQAGSTETLELETGCQLNVAVGQFPSEAIQTIVDAGGVVTVENVGVYQVTVKKVGLHEDDARWLDLRDYEYECRTNLPVVVSQSVSQ